MKLKVPEKGLKQSLQMVRILRHMSDEQMACVMLLRTCGRAYSRGFLAGIIFASAAMAIGTALTWALWR